MCSKFLLPLRPHIIISPEFILMTYHFDSHTKTDVKPEMLSGVQTGNRIPHGEYNIRSIAHAHTYRKDDIFMQRRLVQSFTEWVQATISPEFGTRFNNSYIDIFWFAVILTENRPYLNLRRINVLKNLYPNIRKNKQIKKKIGKDGRKIIELRRVYCPDYVLKKNINILCI